MEPKVIEYLRNVARIDKDTIPVIMDILRKKNYQIDNRSKKVRFRLIKDKLVIISDKIDPIASLNFDIQNVIP